MPRPKLFSHIHSDPDSIFSLCAGTRLVPGMENAERIRVSGRWDGSGMGPLDMAVDIPAGGKGLKGRVDSHVVHSALATVVERFASAEDKKVLKYLVDYIDSHDSYGSVVRDKISNASGLAKWVLGGCGIIMAIFAIKLAHTTYSKTGEALVDEETVFQRVLEIFDGILEMGRRGIPIAAGIDNDYANYLLRGYQRKENSVAIQAVLRFYSIKQTLGESGSLVVDHLLGTECSKEIRTLFAVNSIDAVLGVLAHVHRNAWKTFESRVSEMLDGFMKIDEADARAKAVANKAELFANGKVALTRGGPAGTNNALRRRGVVAIVYKDKINCGVVVKGRPFILRDGSVLKANHPSILRVIERAGDPPGLWFVHPSKYLVANGTEKAPTDVESRVNEYDLVYRIRDLVQGRI